MALGSDLHVHYVLGKIWERKTFEKETYAMQPYLDYIIDILFSARQRDYHKKRWRTLPQVDQDAMAARGLLIQDNIRSDKTYRPDPQKMRRLLLGRE